MKIKKSKKSQSSIIITILLILICLTGISILAAWIIPMIKDNLAEAGANAKIYLNEEGTFYNENIFSDAECMYEGCIPSPLTYVKVGRNQDESDLVGIKFIFKKGDKTFIYLNKKIPNNLEFKTYAFQLIGENKTDSVSIAPIVLVNGKEKTLSIADTLQLKTLSLAYPRVSLEYSSIPLSSSSGELPPVIPPQVFGN
jgi:hypothetical protein